MCELPFDPHGKTQRALCQHEIVCSYCEGLITGVYVLVMTDLRIGTGEHVQRFCGPACLCLAMQSDADAEVHRERNAGIDVGVPSLH